MRNLILLFFFSFLPLPSLLYTEEAEKVDVEKVAGENEKYIEQKTKEFIEKYRSNFSTTLKLSLRFSHRTDLPLATTTRSFTITLEKPYPGHIKIVFFGCNEECEKFLKGKKFDYGYCIHFSSLEEVEEFKKKAGIDYPIALITSDDLLRKFFGIKSYPAVVEVEGKVIKIKEVKVK